MWLPRKVRDRGTELWPGWAIFLHCVDDLATSELMARFYRRLLQGGRPPAAALRAAQLEMAADRRWRDPYFWAGFVVLGDWR
jgi:CHAT domain-containing protein